MATKKTAKNIGPKRSIKGPKYLNVITERAAPKGKSATSEKEEKRSRKHERLYEQAFKINFVGVLFLSYTRPESKR